MRRWGWGLLVTALMSVSTGLQAQDEVQAIRAWFDDPAQLQDITPLLGHARIDRNKGVLITEADPWLRSRLIAAGFRVEVDAQATQNLLRWNEAMFQPSSIPGYSCYRTVEEAQARIAQLATTHPGLVSYLDIGSSWETGTGAGYPMRVIRATSSATPGPKPILFLIGSIHAREYTPAELVLRFVEELVEGYGVDADATWILDHHEIQVLVHANPDGRKRAETGILWRKNANNTHCAGGNRRGVDLNRNFPFVWGEYGGSSDFACDDTFRGPTANSEPETQAIVQHTRSIYPDRRGPALTDAAPDDTSGLFIDVHSYSQLVLWPWGFIQTRAPNATALEALGRRLAGFNGYTAQASIGLYATDGTTDDFAYGELGVASYAMELGTAFFQSCNDFENQVLGPNRALLRYAARVLRAPYRLPFGPDAHSVRIEPDLIFAGDPVQVVATFDDERQQTASAANSGPVPAVQPIASARAYLTLPPWQSGAQPLAMLPEDGGFNATIETARASVPSAGLAVGKHLVFVQGRDSSGADGPAAAAFLEVVAPDQAAALSGTVSDAISGAALGAQVQVGTWTAATDPVDGSYARLVRAGSYPITASAPGYESETSAPLNFVAGAALTRDFGLYRLCQRLEDPVELNQATPFVAQSPWQRRAGQGRDGGAAWLQSASGNHGHNLDVTLSSPVLNLAGYNTVNLQFEQRCSTEATFDFGIVEVSTNGGSGWSEVFRCDGETSWRKVSLALPQLDGQANARLRFRFTSDGSVNAPGWAVDNIVLQAGGAACRASQLPPVRIDSLAATPATILRGNASTLSWATANASACELEAPLGSTPVALTPQELASGSRLLSPVTTSAYRLRCSGPQGPVTRQATITVEQPVAILAYSASPTQIVAGDAVRLDWSVEHAQSCRIDTNLGGSPIPLPVPGSTSGSVMVVPMSDAVFTLQCDGPGGPVTSAVSITVLPRVQIAAFTATPSQIVAGDSSLLAWQTTNASDCSIRLDGQGVVRDLEASEIAQGSLSVSPTANAGYELSCEGNGGPVSRTAEVTVNAPLPDSIFSHGFE